MREKQFSRAFYGYDRKSVDHAIADILREIAEETDGSNGTEGQRQNEKLLKLLKQEVKAAEVRDRLLKRTRVYSHDFSDYLQGKARDMAQDILIEAEEYVKEKQGEIAGVIKKIEEIEKHLAMIRKETESILAVVPLENLTAQASNAKVIPFVPAHSVLVNTEHNQNQDQNQDQNMDLDQCKESGGTETGTTAGPIATEKPAVGSGNLTVLVVEDDEIVMRLLLSLLTREGFTVSTAKDGHEAIKLIDAMTPPQLVLLDSLLPYNNGLQLLKHIRSKPAWRKTIVIMMPDNHAEKDVIAAIKNGADDSIQKPFNPRELVARLNRHVQRLREPRI